MTGHRTPKSLIAYVLALAAAASASGVVLAHSSLRAPGHSSWIALPMLGVLVVAAEYLFVKFRFRGEITALNLVEAALLPVVWAFSGPIAMVTVAIAQLIAEILRRNKPVKALFNVSQWSLATAAGSAVMSILARGNTASIRTIGALAAAVVAIAVVNHICFTFVLAIANNQTPWSALRSAVLIPGWVVPWVMNWLMGTFFVLAYVANPAGSLLFPLPLAVLHLAYRGYAGARSDRVRLAGLHEAAQILAEPFDPRDAIGPFLSEVARCFESSAAAMVLLEDGQATAYRIRGSESEIGLANSLEQALLQINTARHVTVRSTDPIVGPLRETEWSDCLAVPITQSGERVGALAIFDQTGLEGFEAGEIAVLEALARETAGTLAKGTLLNTILEERRMLADIVGSSSDGIFTFGTDGRILSWNPAMERLTGVLASDVVSQPDGAARLRIQTADGDPVRLSSWFAEASLPTELRVAGPDGRPRSVFCSYATATSSSGSDMLIAIMRDMTPHEEMAALRERYGRLAEVQATQRAVVEQLQSAVMPARPEVGGVELGISYLSSDPSAPTGGDLYDWYLLPNGELHLAVVDVLGHGVLATQDAVAVVHTLRLLALQGCKVEDIIQRADILLTQGYPHLVATVVVARHDPKSGRVQLAGGGHPPPLVVHPKTRQVSQIVLTGGPIGWPNAGSRDVVELILDPGQSIVFYTDGLVESRRDIIEGTKALMRHAVDLQHMSAEALAAQLVYRALSEGDRRDDSLALVLRHTPMPVRPNHRAWRIRPEVARAHAIRHELVGWLLEMSIDSDSLYDLELIAGELLSNALRAGRSSVVLRAWVEPSVVIVEVEDDGTGQRDLGRLGKVKPDPQQETGRGLYIVNSVADEVNMLSTVEGTIVRIVKRIELPNAGLSPNDREVIDA